MAHYVDPAQLCDGRQEGAHVQVLGEVVEQSDLQQKLLSSDDVGRKIQGQEEILEDCELQEGHMETAKKNQNHSTHTLTRLHAILIIRLTATTEHSLALPQQAQQMLGLHYHKYMKIIQKYKQNGGFVKVLSIILLFEGNH